MDPQQSSLRRHDALILHRAKSAMIAVPAAALEYDGVGRSYCYY